MAFITIKKSGQGSSPPKADKKAQSGGMFSQKKPVEQPFDFSYALTELNTMGRRLRVLEERFSDLDRRSQVTDQNMLAQYKKIGDEVKTINLTLVEFKSEMESIKNRIREMVSELRKTAKEEDVKVIEKYVNMWSPIKYVSHNEIEKIVREIIDKMREEGQ